MGSHGLPGAVALHSPTTGCPRVLPTTALHTGRAHSPGTPAAHGKPTGRGHIGPPSSGGQPPVLTPAGRRWPNHLTPLPVSSSRKRR